MPCILVCCSPSLLHTFGQVTNAMSHAKESLAYMGGLVDPQVFRFCAIPQVMAIATLGACYNNPEVFKKVVKIPRSMRCSFPFAPAPANCRSPHTPPAQRSHHGDHPHHE